MNSSLLVPALVVVAATAGVFVFGESLFSGGSSVDVSKKAVNKSVKTKQPADAADVVKASTSAGSDFSWDEDTTEQSPIQRPTESFVSTKQTEEAPGELYGSEFDSDSQSFNSQSESDFDSVDDFAASDLGSGSPLSDAGADDFAAASAVKDTSDQVEDDLQNFFEMASKPPESNASKTLASGSKSDEAPKASTKSTTSQTADSSNFDVALSAPKSNSQSVDAFDNFGSKGSDFAAAPAKKSDDEMKSVVTPRSQKSVAKKADVAKNDDAASVISGALEPLKDASVTGRTAKTPVRKFKITNPKETTLAVTLSVDGKQVTLQPDQSFVIQQSDGDVEVTFSRGGSFGFEKKTIKKGHYRFTVSREEGWKLIN